MTLFALKNFNPRSLAGATLDADCDSLGTELFQSTLPRGSDSTFWTTVFVVIYFNPRSLAGATGIIKSHPSQDKISIHAPSRERLDGCLNAVDKVNFNPRSLAGATIDFCIVASLVIISIHAPSRERQSVQCVSSRHFEISIHAPSRERRD